MEAVYSEGRPDLVVITGDVVTDAPIIKGWHSIIGWLDSHQVPYIVAMGNHDAEFFVRSHDELLKARAELGSDPTDTDEDVARHYIYSLLMQSPYYVGDLGHEVSGWGNVAVPIYGSQDPTKVQNVIYILDSHDYPANHFDGYYDWIHTDQVAWYSQKSTEFTKANAGEPVPSLAFFHIPLPEFFSIIGGDTTYGHQSGYVDSGAMNSGLFTHFYENGDVIGVYSGHDHGNDYVGVHHGIALGFGRVSGWNAVGRRERGGRIIELTEGSRSHSTYVITKYGREATVWLPQGMNSEEEDHSTYLPAIRVRERSLKHGVAYEYYEGIWQSTSEFKDSQRVSKGTMESIDITRAPAEDHFGYVFNTLLKVDKRAVYRFKLLCDDGAQILIDGQTVVDNDGSHSESLSTGKVALDEGYHRLTVRYFDDYMGQSLQITIGSRHFMDRPLEPGDLYLE